MIKPVAIKDGNDDVFAAVTVVSIVAVAVASIISVVIVVVVNAYSK